MTIDEMVRDSFETMPGRLKAAELDPDFKALIGFEIGAQADLICERETINDVFARQCIPARLMG